MQFDPRNPQFRANPYLTYQHLRTHDPIHYRPKQGDWVITRYADIVALLKDSRIGHLVQALPAPAADQWQELPPPLRQIAKLRDQSQRLTKLWIISQNPPTHTRLHRLLYNAFTLQRIKNLTSHIQTTTNALIDQVQTAGKLDIVQEFALPLTASVFFELLNVPDTNYSSLIRWSQEVTEAIDLDVAQATYERSLTALIGLTQYFRRFIATYQNNTPTRDDFLSTLLQAQSDGLLSDEELLANYIMLFLGSSSSIKNLIGNGMLALLQHPNQLRMLQTDPTRIKVTIYECLRYNTSVQVTTRTVLTDMEWGGRTFKKGQRIHLVLGAGNRDPEQFPEPDKFDICRQPNSHLSFGRGMHYCLGARLVKEVTKIAVGTLVRRLPNITLTDQPLQWGDCYMLRGLKALPVIF